MRFVSKFDDLSSDERGYQFKFYCDACGAGRVSRLQPAEAGGSLLRAAGEFLSELVVPVVAPPPGEGESAAGGRAREEAFGRAVSEAGEHFRRCAHCGRWVCAESCWDEAAGRCREACADVAGVSDRATRTKRATTRDEGRGGADDAGRTAGPHATREMEHAAVVCASCGAEVGAAKFCPECAAPVRTHGGVFCPACGRRAEGEPTFCPECGAKMSAVT